MSAFAIEVRRKCYPALDRAAARVALEGLRLELDQGEFVAVFGPSGCGKTTLLNIVAGLDRDFEGEVRIGGDGSGAKPAIGYVFQEPRLLPWRTVAENIELVLGDRPGQAGLVDRLLAVTGLEDARHLYASRLSMGMGRRVALARAFAIRPELLLMDEPFVSLDAPTAHRLRLLLLEIWRARPTTVLFVTHDLREAILLADRIAVLSPAPGSVIAEVAVELARSRRLDADAIEAYRAQLLARHPELFGPESPATAAGGSADGVI